MNKLRAVNNIQLIGLIILIIGAIGHIFISIYGALTYPEYNTFAAYWSGFKDFPIIGITSLMNIAIGYILIHKK